MLGTLKSSVTHSLLRRRATYLALNKRSKISTDFRLCKILMQIYLKLHMTEKKAKEENDSFKRSMTQSFNPQSTGAPNVNFRKISVRKTI